MLLLSSGMAPIPPDPQPLTTPIDSVYPDVLIFVDLVGLGLKASWMKEVPPLDTNEPFGCFDNSCIGLDFVASLGDLATSRAISRCSFLSSSVTLFELSAAALKTSEVSPPLGDLFDSSDPVAPSSTLAAEILLTFSVRLLPF